MKRCCSKSFEELDTDEYEKEMIREDLMLMKGEVKLLHQQNRDLLTKLNYAVIFTRYARAMFIVVHVSNRFSFRINEHLSCRILCVIR